VAILTVSIDEKSMPIIALRGKESFITVLVQSTNTQVAKCKLAIVYLQLFDDTFQLKGTAAAINIEEANDTTHIERERK
jgi:hypothetical protein